MCSCWRRTRSAPARRATPPRRSACCRAPSCRRSSPSTVRRLRRSTCRATARAWIGCCGTARNSRPRGAARGCLHLRAVRARDFVGAARNWRLRSRTGCVEWVDDADVPFPFHGGVRLADQAQFDPMPLLDSLVAELDERGGRLAQGVRVQKVSGTATGSSFTCAPPPARSSTSRRKQCVLATGIPILDRGGFFARLKPSRSYCMAYQVPGTLTRGMYISTDSPTRSVRYAPHRTATGSSSVAPAIPLAGRRVRRRRCRSWTSGPKKHYPRRDADPLLVGAGLHARRRAALRRADPARATTRSLSQRVSTSGA